jgi:hypothetical protein
MDRKPEKKIENGKARAGAKTTAGNGGASGRKAKGIELTEEEIRAEKRRKLTLKVFRLIYEDHHKSR